MKAFKKKDILIYMGTTLMYLLILRSLFTVLS
jgi:hypothetical protein